MFLVPKFIQRVRGLKNGNQDEINFIDTVIDASVTASLNRHLGTSLHHRNASMKKDSYGGGGFLDGIDIPPTLRKVRGSEYKKFIFVVFRKIHTTKI